jgi:UDP-GlcNAc:undecaprenyl-phosphate GlcNAc-1-phosphate transferase
MGIFLYIYFGSFVLAILTTPIVILVSGRIGIVDRPGVRKVHERPIPCVGGVAIFFSMITLVISAIFLNNEIHNSFRVVQVQLIMLLSSTTIVFIIGLVDDLMGLSARTKFLLEILVATALCFGGLRISRVTLVDEWTLSLGNWGYALTILWIVGLTNAINLSDGLDGLAAGVCSIACGVIALFAFLSSNVIMSVVMLALLGSLCGFLVFNFHPAKVFMGDCGSLFLGFVIASSSVMCTMKSTTLVGLALPVLALGVPIFDTLFSMLRRFLNGRSPFAPDRNHFHHLLLELGFNQRCAVLITYMVTLLSTSLGLLMLVINDIHSLFLFGGILLFIVVVFCAAAGMVQKHAILNRFR